MNEIDSKTEVTTLPFADAAELRIKIVGEQRKIEEEFVRDPKGRAFFFVKNPLTPMYIDPDAIQPGETFVIKPGFESAIPENLIAKEVLDDPRQLSTVLGRVLSLDKLRKNPVFVFYINDRKNVDTKMYERFKAEHQENFTFIQISDEEYRSFKEIRISNKEEEIAEATYIYHQGELNSKLVEQCVFATQANNPSGCSRWEILKDSAAAPAIIELKKLLKKHNLDPIPEPTEVASFPKAGLFCPQSNDAGNSSSTTEISHCFQP